MSTEQLANWMIANGFATGHGDSVEDLLAELSLDVRELRERAIKREMLEGLRDAYIVVATTQNAGPGPYDALESCIEVVLEEAGMIETVRQAIQKDWEDRRKRREATIKRMNPDEYLLAP